MKKCRYCKVSVLDPTEVCPLCHSVLETVGDAQKNGTKENETKEWMYPDVRDVSRVINFLVKLYLFLAIVSEAALIIINYILQSRIWWSAITGVALIYSYITLRYSVQKNGGYLRTILIQIFGAILLTFAIDWIIGYRGWSVNFVFPGSILLLDVATLVLMLVNLENWQSYMLLQILTILLGIIALVLWHAGIIIYPIVTIVAASVSVAFFIGTLIFGDRRARNELKRRFHV